MKFYPQISEISSLKNGRFFMIFFFIQYRYANFADFRSSNFNKIYNYTRQCGMLLLRFGILQKIPLRSNTKTVKFYLKLFEITSFEKKQFFYNIFILCKTLQSFRLCYFKGSCNQTRSFFTHGKVVIFCLCDKF